MNRMFASEDMFTDNKGQENNGKSNSPSQRRNPQTNEPPNRNMNDFLYSDLNPERSSINQPSTGGGGGNNPPQNSQKQQALNRLMKQKEEYIRKQKQKMGPSKEINLKLGVVQSNENMMVSQKRGSVEEQKTVKIPQKAQSQNISSQNNPTYATVYSRIDGRILYVRKELRIERRKSQPL